MRRHYFRRFPLATCFPSSYHSAVIAIGVLAYIPSLRHRELLQRTLVSIRTQQGAPAYTVTIVDNGNESASTQVWLRELSTAFQARLVRRENREIAAARDLFLRELSEGADFCAFVDSDIELPLNWLAELYKTATSGKPSERPVAAVASVNRPPAQESAFNDALLCFFSSRLALLGAAQALQVETPEDVTHLSSCAVLYHRASALAAGGYRTRYTMVCEDLEFSYRLKSKGRFVLLPEPAVTHRQDEGEGPWFARMYRYGWGQIEVMRDHSDHAKSLKLIPPLAMAVLFFALFRTAVFGRPDVLVFVLMTYMALIPTSVMSSASRLRKPLTTAFRAVGIAAGSHFVYALGSFLGICGVHRNPPSAERQA